MSAAPLRSEAPHRLRVLRLLLKPTQVSGPYNQFTLPWCNQQEITLCTFFEPTLRIPSAIRVHSGDATPLGFLRALRRALREGDYDVVHAHSPHVGFLFWLATCLARRRTPPAVYTLHTSYQNLKLRNLLLLLPVFATFQSVVCCSRASLESLPGLLRRLGGRRLGSVPNGVDIARVDRALARRPRAADDPVFEVISVSRLIELKNPLRVLEAFRPLAARSARLRWIGQGPLEGALREASRSAGIDQQVELSGLLPREEVYRALARADVFVSASRCEGLPVAVLEAMACGCPVVLSDIPPHREIARGADWIPLVPLHDVQALARELERMRALAPASRRELGRLCRRHVERRFGLEAMGRGYQEVYAESLSG